MSFSAEGDVLVGRVLGAAVGLACVALLASCALLPPGSAGDEQQQADVQMQHIADAVKSDDAAALTRLFSVRARKRATDLDSGVKYFLSVLPSGPLTWELEDGAPGSAEENADGYTEEVYAFYKISVKGKKYELYFADLTENTNDQENVGIYALAVEPYSAERFAASGAAKPFFVWTGSHQLADDNVVTGAPGVYVPQN